MWGVGQAVGNQIWRFEQTSIHVVDSLNLHQPQQNNRNSSISAGWNCKVGSTSKNCVS